MAISVARPIVVILQHSSDDWLFCYNPLVNGLVIGWHFVDRWLPFS